MAENLLYYGDNLAILQNPEYFQAETVDLIYLDPPFKSNVDYNVLFAEHDGTPAAAQIKAFEDTWEWNEAAATAYADTLRMGGKVAQAMRAFRTFLGDTDMLAYLAMMAPRLVELRRVLKPTGSIYLHCDPTASHYLKMLMDAIFGATNFRNEIIWYYYNKMHDRRKRLFPRATDTLLFYVKDVTADFTYVQLKEMRDAPVMQLARKKVQGRMVNVKDAEGHVVYRMKADRTVDNVWRIPCLQPAATEKLGYQTQKPVALLARIIEASSREGDTVLDPFCGCGTAIAAAQQLNRRWIGIDVTQAAIVVIKSRLATTFGRNVQYRIVGEPVTVPDAEALAEHDRHQFEWWALGLVGARPTPDRRRRGPDRGIDGRLYFDDDPASGETKLIILSVKSGQVGADKVRELCGVVEREDAAIGVLITCRPPTGPMRREAASMGFYESLGWGRQQYPRIQILTVAELFAGKTIAYPAPRNITFTRRRRGRGPHNDSLTLPEV